MNREKKIFLAMITFIAAGGISLSIYYRLYKPELHPLVQDTNKRQKLIEDIWQSAETALKNTDKSYLDPKGRLTPKGITFVTKTVQEKMAEAVGMEALNTYENLQLLKKMLTSSIIASYTVLEWCPCIHPDKRVNLAYQMILEIKKQHPDRRQLLTYISLGSGDLLQDFIAIEALIKLGYCNLDINLIDLNYRHVIHISLAEKKKITKAGMNGSKESEIVKQIIQSFKNYLSTLIADKPELTCTVEVEPFTSAYTYIDLVKNKLEEKPDIMVMADPTRYLPYLKTDTIEEANMVELSDNDLVVVLPENQKPKAYLPVDSSRKFLENDVKKIQEIIHTTKDNNYRAALKKGLVAYIKEGNITLAKKRKLTFYAEPFITYQDLIRHTAKPTSLAFGLYQIEGIGEDMVHHITIEQLKDADVVTKNVGRNLITNKRRQYKEIELEDFMKNLI